MDNWKSNPNAVRAFIEGKKIADALKVPLVRRVASNGLYVQFRKNQKHGKFYRVVLNRDSECVFREDVPLEKFPNDLLITNLMLLV